MSKVFVRDREFYKLLLALGLPIVLKNLIVNSVGMADNLMVAALGEAATNGAQMANQLTNFLFTITMNVSAAVTVLATQYWGKRETRSIKTLAGIGLKFSMALGVAAFILGFFFPDFTLGLFTNDAALLAFTAKALRVYCGALCLFGAQIACQMTFVSTGNAVCSIIVAILRKFVLLIPLVYLMPRLMADQTMAVYTAEPIADGIAVLCTVMIFAVQFKKALHRLDEART